MSIGRRHIASTLAVAFALPFASATSAHAYVYWVNYDSGAIGRANLDGSKPDQRFITGVKGAQSVAVDAKHVYWTNYDTSTIGRANLDGSNSKSRFITGTTHPWGIASDGSHVYWTHGFDVGRASADGASIEPGFITGTPGVGSYGVAVDAAHVYWTANSSVDNWIGRAELDGTAVNRTFLASGGDPRRPQLLAADAGHLFWTNNGAASSFIGRANLDGTEANPTFSATQGTAGAPAVDASHLYWTTGANTIARSALDGTGANYRFLTGLKNPHGIAVDGLTKPSAKCTVKSAGARTKITCTLTPAAGLRGTVRLKRGSTTLASGRLTPSGTVVFTTRTKPRAGSYQLTIGKTTISVHLG